MSNIEVLIGGIVGAYLKAFKLKQKSVDTEEINSRINDVEKWSNEMLTKTDIEEFSPSIETFWRWVVGEYIEKRGSQIVWR